MIEKEIKLDDKLVVSVKNFPLMFIEELFKNQIMGISRDAESLEPRLFWKLGYDGDGANSGKPMQIRRREYESNNYGIFENPEHIRGGTSYRDGAVVWVCRGGYKGNDYTVILKYNSQNEISPEVKLRVTNKWVVVPTKLKDEIDKAISIFMIDNLDTDNQA